MNATSRIGESTIHGNVVQAGVANIHPPQPPPPDRRALWIGLLLLGALVGLGSGLLLVRGQLSGADLARDGRSPSPPVSSASPGSPPAPSPPEPVLPPEPTPAPSPAPASGPVSVPVQWQGQLTLDTGMTSGRMIWGYGLDSVPPGTSPTGDLRLQCVGGCEQNQVTGQAVIPWPGPNPPSREDCRHKLNTVLGQQTVTVRPGSMACFGTAKMRVGYFTARSVGNDGRTTLDVTVWELPPGS
ncbi:MULTISPECIES: hypothetical protein [Streptomycetaceae]|uniref:hypothetical protein n=1 Tax=Streptomycetaceae TaxID=2062 RepID=UPI00093CDC91|nr:hypothetical protein [Streptomyces sp. CB02056]OKI02890.1 hypothetical protein AMK13_30290 [Streptomyces sp. CB02056]